MKINMKNAALLLLLTLSASFSQSLLAVRYPAGNGSTLASAAARMGGAGAGLNEPYLMSSLNTANVGAIKQSVYTLSVNSEYQRIRIDDDYVSFVSFTPSFIGFAFPISKAGTLAASFKQSASNRYSYESKSFLINYAPGFEDTIAQIEKFDNNVSHSVWDIAWGIQLFRRVSIGLSYQGGQYKNTFVRSDVLQRPHVSSGLDSIYYNQTSSAVTGGVLVNIDKLGVGISATYPFLDDLKTQRSVRRLVQNDEGIFQIARGSQVTLDTTFRMQLPPSGVIGASWTFSQKLKTAIDFSLAMWEGYYWTDAPNLQYAEGELQNAFGVSGGVEFIPQPTLLSARYFQRVRYGGGLSVRQLPIDGDWEGSLSAGFGFPLGTRGVLDVSAQAGVRRSKYESDIKESFVRVNFGVSGGQVWRQTGTNFY